MLYIYFIITVVIVRILKEQKVTSLQFKKVCCVSIFYNMRQLETEDALFRLRHILVVWGIMTLSGV